MWKGSTVRRNSRRSACASLPSPKGGSRRRIVDRFLEPSRSYLISMGRQVHRDKPAILCAVCAKVSIGVRQHKEHVRSHALALGAFETETFVDGSEFLQCLVSFIFSPEHILIMSTLNMIRKFMDSSMNASFHVHLYEVTDYVDLCSRICQHQPTTSRGNNATRPAPGPSGDRSENSLNSLLLIMSFTTISFFLVRLPSK